MIHLERLERAEINYCEFLVEEIAGFVEDGLWPSCYVDAAGFDCDKSVAIWLEEDINVLEKDINLIFLRDVLVNNIRL